MFFKDRDLYKDKFGIYCITNLLNGKTYIGQTGESFLRRFWHHQWKLRNHKHDNPHLQAAFDKYGDDCFEFIVLEVCSTKDELDSKEIYYIAQESNSYNILAGGGGRRGAPMSEHAKKLLSEKNRAKMTGKKHSELSKARMSASRTGQPYTRHRSTTVINEEIAQSAKKMLIQGLSVSSVAAQLSVPRNTVANMLTNNTWSNAVVDGWDEFRENRKIHKRLTKEQVTNILYQHSQGVCIQQLAAQYDRTAKEISRLIPAHQ